MDHEQFISQLTEFQNGLYAYIYTLIGDHSKAHDVLQESNIVMWRKRESFDGKNFNAWAVTICKFQVKAYFRDLKRDHLLLDENLAEQVSDLAEKEQSRYQHIEPELMNCIASLPDKSRSMIEMVYYEKMKLQEIAHALNKKLSAVKVTLFRVRKALRECIENKLEAGQA
jgi:RNA polymerase sigma-70 factor (ECF subfamily)